MIWKQYILLQFIFGTMLSMFSVAVLADREMSPADYEMTLRVQALHKLIMDSVAVAKCHGPKRKIEKVFACFEKLSDKGNSQATVVLAEIYGATVANHGSPGLEHDEVEDYRKKLDISENAIYATQLVILAIKQGDYGDHLIPPRPYKWELGMSDFQVRNSIDGEPENIIKSTTEYGVIETWIYPQAVLSFEKMTYYSNVLRTISEIK